MWSVQEYGREPQVSQGSATLLSGLQCLHLAASRNKSVGSGLRQPDESGPKPGSVLIRATLYHSLPVVPWRAASKELQQNPLLSWQQDGLIK